MSSHSGDHIKIDRGDLVEHYRAIDGLMKKISINSNRVSQAHRTAHEALFGRGPRDLSFAASALKVEGAGFAMADSVNHTYWVVRTALGIAAHVYDLYRNASGLEMLLKEGRHGGSERERECREKTNTACAVFAFVTASYVLHELRDYEVEKVSATTTSFKNELQFPLTSMSDTRKDILAQYTVAISDETQVHTQYEFVKMTLEFFSALLDDIKLKEESLRHLNAFKSQSYKLEDSDFIIDGFEVRHVRTSSMEFNRVSWNDIVGNTGSKHKMRRSIGSLMCYDPETGRNPMKDLGGFARINLSFGPPGTGKSLEIAAAATELSDRCEELGIPFLFHPFPDTIVSTYQGGSAERAVEWFTPLRSFDGIVFAPIDDAENNLMNRAADGVSSGTKEVVGVFLRMTEGAYAIDHGNSLINLYTNLPDAIDPAVLSRIQGRAEMLGAVTREDFMDQDHIGLFRPFGELAPNFIDVDAGRHAYMEAQNISAAIAETYKGRAEPETDEVKEILALVRKRHGSNRDHGFFAELDVLMRERHGYTSRDKRNVQSAVKTRLFDFDFPSEWFESPETFFKQGYDTKRVMILELMRESLKGKTFSDIMFEETIFYFDNAVRVRNQGFERAVAQRVEQLRISAAAQKRFSEPAE